MSDQGRENETVTEALKTVGSGGILVFGSKVVALFLGFLTQLVMARFLLPETYGNVVLALATVTVGTLAATLGLDDGVMRKMPEFEDDDARARGVVRAGVRISAVSGFVVAVCLFVLAPTIAVRIFEEPSLTPLLRIGAVSIPFMVVGKIAIYVVRGLRSARPYAYVYQLFRMTARFVLVAGFLLAGFRAVGAVLGQIVALVLTGILGFGLAYRKLPRWDGVEPVNMDRHLLAFSLPLIVVHGMDFLILNTDSFLIGYFLESEQIGIYNIVFQVRSGLITILVASGFLLPPVLTRLQNDGKSREIQVVYQVVTKWVVFATLPVVLTMIVFPETILGFLFGEAYAIGATTLQILAVGAVVTIATGANGESLIGLDRNRDVMYTTTLSTFLNVGLNIALIPRFGILGAAVASTTAIAAKNVANVTILYREFGVVPLSTGGASSATASLAIGGAGYLLIEYLGLPALLIAAGWLVSYPLVIVRFRGIAPEDEQVLLWLESYVGREFTFVRQIMEYRP